MANLDMTAFDAGLKVRYTDDAVADLVYEVGGPLFDLMPKYEKFTGKQMVVPLIWGDPQGVSASVSNAVTQSTAGTNQQGKIAGFAIAHKRYYGVASIDNLTIEASGDKEGAFLEAAEFQIDGILRQVGKNTGVQMFRAGWGDVGKISSIGSSIITLTKKEDACNFEVGQTVVFSSSQNAATLRDSGNAVAVTVIDRNAGTVTIASTPSGVVANDFIFPQGDRENSATPSRQVIAGLESWLPSSAPSSTSFFGVDRSSDVTRLGGLRLDGTTGGAIQELLYEAAALVAREGGKLSHFFMPFSKWIALEKSFDGKATVVTESGGTASIGYEAIVVRGPKGSIKCVADAYCPADRIFGLSMPTWKLYSLGKAVRIFDTDGNKLLRESTSDAVQVRAVSYREMACSAPGHNINIQVNAAT